MKYRIDERVDGLRIEAHVPPEQQKHLLDEFSKCAAGTCSCPSTQYEKLTAIDVKPAPEGVTVELTAKTGEEIDRQDIEKCLDNTARVIGG